MLLEPLDRRRRRHHGRRRSCCRGRDRPLCQPARRSTGCALRSPSSSRSAMATCCDRRPGAPSWRSAIWKSRPRRWASTWHGPRHCLSSCPCFVTGLAGALMAHYLGAFNYEAFLITLSIQMLLMIVVGGMGSIHGAFFGAMVIGVPAAPSSPRIRQHITLNAIPGLDTGIFCVDPDCHHHRRAARHLRPMGQDADLSATVSIGTSRPVPAPASLSEDGAAEMSFFVVEHLSKSFGGVRAVDDISFTVEKGEVFTIVGPNGAGKSTIFNLISRFYDPTTGRIEIEGQTSPASARHEVIGLRHRAHVSEHRTVRPFDRAAKPAGRPPQHAPHQRRREPAVPAAGAGRGTARIAMRSSTSSISSTCSLIATR